MKIAVYGESILPVLPYGCGGLGRMTHEHAVAFLEMGHDVTLYSPLGGEFKGKFVKDSILGHHEKYDVIFDCSHAHELSTSYPHFPVLNHIGDRECTYIPPNTVVESNYMRGYYPNSKIVPAGVDMRHIPFSSEGGNYLIFMGLNAAHKQPDVAKLVAKEAGKDIIFIGADFSETSEVSEDEKWRLLGGALGLLCTYTIDASPRAPLEAAACGTPTLCLDGDGTRDHVLNGVTGYIDRNQAEMIEDVGNLKRLDRNKIQQWARKNHSIYKTAGNILRLMENLVKGKRW